MKQLALSSATKIDPFFFFFPITLPKPRFKSHEGAENDPMSDVESNQKDNPETSNEIHSSVFSISGDDNLSDSENDDLNEDNNEDISTEDK